MRLESICCPACGSDKKFLKETTPDHNMGVCGTFTIQECSVCEMAFLSPRPISEDMHLAYPQQYANSYKEGTGFFNKIAFNKRLSYIKSKVPSGKILEIGCSAGHLLSAIKKEGYDVTGLEIDSRTASYAKQTYGLNVINSPLESATLPAEEFDAIVLFGVLEHFSNPVVCLTKIYQALKKGGILILEVPNFGCIEAKMWGQYWYGNDLPRHLLHFTDKTLSAIISKTGFEILALNYPHESNYCVQSLAKLFRSISNCQHRSSSDITTQKKSGFNIKNHIYLTFTLINGLVSPLYSILKQGNCLQLCAKKP